MFACSKTIISLSLALYVHNKEALGGITTLSNTMAPVYDTPVGIVDKIEATSCYCNGH